MALRPSTPVQVLLTVSPPPPKRVRFSNDDRMDAAARIDLHRASISEVVFTDPFDTGECYAGEQLNSTLMPRKPWMLEDDDRTDAEADANWHSANARLFGVHPPLVPAAEQPLPTLQPGSVTRAMLSALVTATSDLPTCPSFDVSSAYLSSSAEPPLGLSTMLDYPSTHGPHLNSKVVRRILAARESIFKYGIYLPRNDFDADVSPERTRWNSGRQLEWLRLKQVGAFEYDWTRSRMALEHPDYAATDIGYLFFIYDYKFSGEHRVRLVFDGSRQSPSTYDETYSPTVRAESIGLFHIYAVELGFDIRQYDVPQAFLQSPIDHVIFVNPPRKFIEFPGQILKLRLALYGAKQSSALFYKLLHNFLLTLGFQPSTMDVCFYRRSDALIIVHVDDMRCAALPDVLHTIHQALYERFQITTGDGSRFLGMDMTHDNKEGVLTMGMCTYIEATLERFTHFDVSLECPYREIVGCLLWIVLCVVGPELVRVKDLARRSNHSTPADYQDALNVLKRIWKRRQETILFKRGGAGLEWIPSQTRPDAVHTDVVTALSAGFLPDDLPYPPTPTIIAPTLPINHRFRTIGFTDASFAVDEDKRSISGFVIFVNGTPIMWGSEKQTTVADSTCAAEFIAASVCCRLFQHVENMFSFFGFLCPKPYRLYTDSQASLGIATNPVRMGMIRHVAIKYHLVRCMATAGDVDIIFCVTEDQIADLFTKVLTGAPFKRLSFRFYYLGPRQ
jgi:hypothetical protein